ncbi:hypothetical protein ACFVGM_08935 [Kitasatospora purpeofusca]|uniref:hypothetical protein n=1 Tax=Kitasatospora purpeofusca TaxID=67352 RepID=UPI00367FC57D
MTDQPNPTPQPNPDTLSVVVPPEPAAPQQQGEKTFTAADLERARGEEKEKLYGRLTKSDERLAGMEAELAQLRAERETKAQQEADAAKAAADADKAKAESEMSARRLVEERTREWDARFAALQEERETERAALLKETEFAQLKAYTQERVNAEREHIAPELLDLISGNNPEEVDASVELLKAKTAQIVENMRAAQEQQQPRIPQRGVSPTGLSATGPGAGEGGVRQLTAKDIKDMSMAEYQKYRVQLLGEAATRNPYQNGLLS